MMKSEFSNNKYGQLFFLIGIIFSGLFIGSLTGAYNNLIVVFGSLGVISLSLTRLLSLVFKTLPNFFGSLQWVTRISEFSAIFMIALYLFS